MRIRVGVGLFAPVRLHRPTEGDAFCATLEERPCCRYKGSRRHHGPFLAFVYWCKGIRSFLCRPTMSSLARRNGEKGATCDTELRFLLLDLPRQLLFTSLLNECTKHGVSEDAGWSREYSGHGDTSTALLHLHLHLHPHLHVRVSLLCSLSHT